MHTNRVKEIRMHDNHTPSVAFERVTPATAEAWLGKNQGNRNLKVRRIAELARDMANHEFAVTGEAIKFDWNGRLIDGQNRLTAVIQSGTSIVTLVVRGLDPTVQAILDTGSKRTGADALKMKTDSTQPTTAAAAIRIINAFDSGAMPTALSKAPEMTHAELLKWHKANATEIDDCVDQARAWTKKLGIPASALAACLFILGRIDADAAHRFFEEMATLKLGGADDPRTILIRRYQSLTGERYMPSQWVYFTIRAWNAWRTGETLRQMKDRNQRGVSRMPKVAA